DAAAATLLANVRATASDEARSKYSVITRTSSGCCSPRRLILMLVVNACKRVRFSRDLPHGGPLKIWRWSGWERVGWQQRRNFPSGNCSRCVIHRRSCPLRLPKRNEREGECPDAAARSPAPVRSKRPRDGF